jgi:hypothetical protein
MNDQDYGDFQSPEGGYGGSQQPGTLYADKGAAPPKPAPATGSPATPTVAPTKSVIHVSVNPGSMIKLAPFIGLISKSPGIAPEFKNRIKLDKNSQTIGVPDYSGGTVIPGKEWLFDLGKAGDDWEVTTATLLISLDSKTTNMAFQEDLQGGDERGYPQSADPDDGVRKPPYDFTGSPLVGKDLAFGVTIPNRTVASKNASYTKDPTHEVADLASKKGLIMITRQVVVGKTIEGEKKVTQPVAIPKVLIAMTFFHELSAHASFFQMGQDAAHSVPLDPVNNPVDRNAKQAEATYRKFVDKEGPALEKKVDILIKAMFGQP